MSIIFANMWFEVLLLFLRLSNHDEFDKLEVDLLSPNMLDGPTNTSVWVLVLLILHWVGLVDISEKNKKEVVFF